MLLKKINRHFFFLITFLQISLSQDYLPSSKIPLSEIISTQNFSPELIASHAGQLAFIDKKNHTLGIYSNDSLRTLGGYGSSKHSFIDPVDIIIDKLDIIVLDESIGRVSKFDANLNFIELYDLISDYQAYPSAFNIDSRRNIYFFSSDENIVYQRIYSTQKVNKFIDYSSNTRSQNCLSDIFINQNDQIGILFDCSNELHIYNRSGRLQRKFKIELENAQKPFFLDGRWAVINSVGNIQFSNGSRSNLFTDQEIVLDSYLDREDLYVLTKTSIYIFDTSIFRE